MTCGAPADPHPVAPLASGTAISGPGELLIKKIAPHPDQRLPPCPTLRNGNALKFPKRETLAVVTVSPAGCRNAVL